MPSIVLIIIPTQEEDYDEHDAANGIPSKSRAPRDEHEQPANLITLLEKSLADLGIIEACWSKTKGGDFYHIVFPIENDEDSHAILDYFRAKGIGQWIDSTSIGLIPMKSYYQKTENMESISNEDLRKGIGDFKEKQQHFLKTATARLEVAQVVASVRNNGTLSFNYLSYAILASWIAALGLVDNGLIALLGSMLVSPMMGPVIAFTFGCVIKDASLRRLGLVSLFVTLGTCMVIGLLFGLIIFNFKEEWADHAWPSKEMSDRGLTRVTWIGMLVSLPSGVALGLSLLEGNQSSLVGVAIAISLLPPAVNVGLLWSFSFICWLHGLVEEEIATQSFFSNATIYLPPAQIAHPKYVPHYADNQSVETLILGVFSFAGVAVNIIGMFIGTVIMLRIKEVVPFMTSSPDKRRFFQQDIPIVRRHNETNTNEQGLGEQLVDEWAKLTGLGKQLFDRHSPEGKKIREQTFADILQDIEEDVTYQSVTRSIATSDQGRLCVWNIVNDGSMNNLVSRQRSSTFSINSKVLDITNRRSLPQVIDEAFAQTEAMPEDQRPDNYDDKRRNSSALLRIQLQETPHSPYSIWPSTTRTPSLENVEKKTLGKKLSAKTMHGKTVSIVVEDNESEANNSIAGN